MFYNNVQIVEIKMFQYTWYRIATLKTHLTPVDRINNVLFMTDITGIRTLACVNTFVCVQTALLCEPFVTHFTLVRPLPRVCSHVNFQVRLATETGLTHL